MTTAIAAVPALDDKSVRRIRRFVLRCTWNTLAALVAVLAVRAAGGAVPTYEAAALTLAWVVAVQGTSRRTPLDGPREELLRVARGALFMALGASLADVLLPLSASAVGAFVALAAAGSAVTQSLAVAGAPALRTIVLGDPEQAATVAAGLSLATTGRLVATSTCTPEELADTLASTSADLVLAVIGPALRDRVLQRVGWQLEAAGLPLLVSTGLADVAAERTRVARVGALDLLHLAPARRQGPANWLKALWERLAAAALLIILAPLLAIIALAIRLDSPGPAIFRQRRVGRDGTTFTILKFRTMHLDAAERLAELRERCDGILFKLQDDPRVTRCGRLLRRYSLDELPQLINVVRGEMALVGPRPALPEEVAAYDDDPRHRLVVKPGLTGLWQVSGRSDLSWEESVRLDLDYVDNWSIGRDLLIVVRTVSAVLAHRGAY